MSPQMFVYKQIGKNSPAQHQWCKKKLLEGRKFPLAMVHRKWEKYGLVSLQNEKRNTKRNIPHEFQELVNKKYNDYTRIHTDGQRRKKKVDTWS
jgi:hypothetical protein